MNQIESVLCLIEGVVHSALRGLCTCCGCWEKVINWAFRSERSTEGSDQWGPGSVPGTVGGAYGR